MKPKRVTCFARARRESGAEVLHCPDRAGTGQTHAPDGLAAKPGPADFPLAPPPGAAVGRRPWQPVALASVLAVSAALVGAWLLGDNSLAAPPPAASAGPSAADASARRPVPPPARPQPQPAKLAAASGESDGDRSGQDAQPARYDFGSGWMRDVWNPRPFHRTVSVDHGDTMMSLLVKAGIDREEAYSAVEAMRPVFDPRRIRPGQQLALNFFPKSDGKDRFIGLSLDTAIDKAITVKRKDDGSFKAKEIERPLVRELRQGSGTINSSLYVSGVDQGVPASVMVDLIRIFSFDVDFQRDIHKGDRFQVMYERLENERGGAATAGNILYTALSLSGRTIRLWRYKTSDGLVDYFDAKGRSVRKALMRTPIDGARISSSFGMRMHPILGFSKMHTGTDFAAPPGTPIYAAGGGVIEMARRWGGYGNYVRIRHNGTYETAYGHMRAFAHGIRPGVRVQQGETIGYVGSTGRSTGPHLHFEVLRHGKPINSQTMKLPSGRKLAGKELKAFETARRRLDEQYAALVSGQRLAGATLENRGKQQVGAPDTAAGDGACDDAGATSGDAGGDC